MSCISDELALKALVEKYNIQVTMTDYVNYTKKLTGYILFSKEHYKRQTKAKKYNSKIISKMWRALNAEEHDAYVMLAKKLSKRPIRRRKKKKVIQNVTKGTKRERMTLFSYETKFHNQLRRITIDDRELVVDCFNNIIDINDMDGEDVGYVNGYGKCILFA